MPIKKRKLREEKMNKQFSWIPKDRSLLNKFTLERLGGVPTPCIGSDSTGQFVYRGTGVGGNKKRHDDKLDTIRDLKAEYSSIWGKSRKAKIIAIDKNISIRTIQRYFREFP